MHGKPKLGLGRLRYPLAQITLEPPNVAAASRSSVDPESEARRNEPGDADKCLFVKIPEQRGAMRVLCKL